MSTSVIYKVAQKVIFLNYFTYLLGGLVASVAALAWVFGECFVNFIKEVSHEFKYILITAHTLTSYEHYRKARKTIWARRIFQ